MSPPRRGDPLTGSGVRDFGAQASYLWRVSTGGPKLGEKALEPGLPANEVDRLHALTAYRILDTPQEGEFDQCVRLIAQICETEIGAMTLIDHDRQWTKAVYGPFPMTLPRLDAFCAHTILQAGVMEVPDTQLDPRFAANPLVKNAPFLRFYAGVALEARSGLALGALCVLDKHPRQLRGEQLKALEIAAAYVSAQLEMRLGVLQLLEERRIAKAQLEAITRASQRQKDLSALVIHDLRSPLASMSANSRYLGAESSLTSGQQSALDDIIRAGETLSGMVNDLLHVSRAEDGQLMVQKKLPFDLGEVTQTAIDHARAIAQERRLLIDFSPDPSRGVVAGDKDILFRVITNLLDNAYRYAPVGSCVQVQVSTVAAFSVLRIVDQGPGIPPEHRALVFDKYFQIKQESPSRPTFGLGLSFCKLAVEAHCGSIEVEAVPKGCSFRVALPLISGEASTSASG